jgi:hypothetical protein
LIGKTVTPENLLEHKEEIRNLLKSPEASEEFKLINGVLEAIEAVVKRNTKVFVSGGNWGPNYINLYTLADGVISSGATFADKQKAPSSADNQALSTFSQGVYNVTRLKNGFDIIGNNEAAVKNREVTGGQNIVDIINGKEVDEVLLADKYLMDFVDSLRKFREHKQFVDLNPGKKPPALNINDFKEYVITVDDFIKALKAVGEDNIEVINEDKDLRSQGKYISCISAIAAEPYLIFDEKDGKIVFDPDRSGRPAISKISGTSYASPTTLSRAIEKA